MKTKVLTPEKLPQKAVAKTNPLSPDHHQKINAYSRAANDLSVGRIYPFAAVGYEEAGGRTLGHVAWSELHLRGSSRRMSYIAGPGHGAFIW